MIENNPNRNVGLVSYPHSIVTMDLSCIISGVKEDRSKLVISFRKNPAFGFPVSVIPSEYCDKISYRKYRMVWLLDSEKFRIRLYVLTQCTNVSQSRTDGRTYTAQPTCERYILKTNEPISM